MNENKSNKLAAGALLGAAAGLVAGLLLAPKSGKETREDLKRGSKKVVKEADKHLKKLHDELSAMVEKTEPRIATMTTSVRNEAEHALLKALKARDQAAAVLTAVRSGNSTDEDLDLAVKNAGNALENLKKFLTK